MGSRYCFEIMDAPLQYNYFAYFDTDDHLGHFLFSHENIDVTVEGEYGAEDDPYRIMLCRVPRRQRDEFLRAVDQLPDLMAYVGKTDYDDFCRHVMTDARKWFAKQGYSGTGFPVQ